MPAHIYYLNWSNSIVLNLGSNNMHLGWKECSFAVDRPIFHCGDTFLGKVNFSASILHTYILKRCTEISTFQWCRNKGTTVGALTPNIWNMVRSPANIWGFLFFFLACININCIREMWGVCIVDWRYLNECTLLAMCAGNVQGLRK